MLGYLICDGCYLLLLIASLTAWRRQLRGSSLAAAFVIQIGWAAVLTARGAGMEVPVTLVAAAECLRDVAWALALARLLTASSILPSRRWMLSIGAVISLVCCLGLMLLPMSSGRAMSVRVWEGLTLSAAGLIVVEQVARNTRSGHQWRLKYVWVAIGGLFAWDLFIYSNALLQGGLEATLWSARGFVNALLAIPLVIGIRRIPTWKAAEFLSPRPVFFSATLLGVVVYITGLAAASYLIFEHGGSWGAVAQAVFLAGGALVLVVALMSEQFRAWTRVTLVKYFFPYRYDYREEWQKLTHALSQSDETSVYERISAVMAGSVNCGAGGLWLRDADGRFTPAGGELAPPEAPVEAGQGPFFEYLCAREWIYDLDAARAADARDALPPAPAWMLANPNLWLVVPLVCEKTLVGFVILTTPLTHMRLTWEEIDLLHAASRQVAGFVALEQAGKRLAEARQFEALNRFSAVLMHDLRHLIAQQALVVQNAARHRGNPAFFDDAILTIDESVKRMTRLMDRLRGGIVMEQKQRVDLAEVCREAVERCAVRDPVPTLSLPDRNIEILSSRDSLLNVIEHVIRNAQDATPCSGTVSVDLQRVGQRAVISVKDTGTGMNREFVRHRLFRPFDTTKGKRGMGIGAYETREFVTRFGGKVDVDSSPGAGTKFTISLPLAVAAATKATTTSDELKAS